VERQYKGAEPEVEVRFLLVTPSAVQTELGTSMTIREWVVENRDKYATKAELVDACVESLGVKKRCVTVQVSKHKLCTASKTKKKAPDSSGGTGGDRTEEFRKRFDKSFIIPQKVYEQIQKWLVEGGKEWCIDHEMQQRCGISNPTDWRRHVKENPEFEAYTFKLPGKNKIVWAQDQETRDRLERISLS
jgi:hypothetical protein